MAQQQSQNSFTGGLQMDTSPMLQGSSTLSNALNATLVTMNGNELSLQNDMGNARVDNTYLPTGYVPIGMKEYGGVIYVAAYNPITNRGQLGSFPSPERRFGSEYEGLISGEVNIDNFFNFLDLNLPYKIDKVFDISSSDTYNDVREAVNYDVILVPLIKELSNDNNTLVENTNIIRAGDKFSIYDNGVIYGNDGIAKYLSNFNNVISEGPKAFALKNNILTFYVGVLNSLNEFVDITPTLKRFDYNQKEPIVLEEVSDSYKFNRGYFIASLKPDIPADDDPSITYDDKLLIEEREKMAVNTYGQKLVGPMYLKMELNTVKQFDYAIDGYKDEDGNYHLSLYSYYKYNFPDKFYKGKLNNKEYNVDCLVYGKPSYVFPLIQNYDKSYGPLTYYLFNNEKGTQELKRGQTSLLEENKNLLYNEQEKLYSTGTKEVIDLSNLEVSNLTIVQYKLLPGMTFGGMKNLEVTGILDLSRLGSGDFELNHWRYYNANNTLTLTYGWNSYPIPGSRISNITFTFYDTSDPSIQEDKGLVKKYKLDYKESYNGVFTESFEYGLLGLEEGNLYLVEIKAKRAWDDGTLAPKYLAYYDDSSDTFTLSLLEKTDAYYEFKGKVLNDEDLNFYILSENIKTGKEYEIYSKLAPVPIPILDSGSTVKITFTQIRDDIYTEYRFVLTTELFNDCYFYNNENFIKDYGKPKNDNGNIFPKLEKYLYKIQGELVDLEYTNNYYTGNVPSGFDIYILNDGNFEITSDRTFKVTKEEVEGDNISCFIEDLLGRQLYYKKEENHYVKLELAKEKAYTNEAKIYNNKLKASLELNLSYDDYTTSTTKQFGNLAKKVGTTKEVTWDFRGGGNYYGEETHTSGDFEDVFLNVFDDRSKANLLYKGTISNNNGYIECTSQLKIPYKAESTIIIKKVEGSPDYKIDGVNISDLIYLKKFDTGTGITITNNSSSYKIEYIKIISKTNLENPLYLTYGYITKYDISCPLKYNLHLKNKDYYPFDMNDITNGATYEERIFLLPSNSGGSQHAPSHVHNVENEGAIHYLVFTDPTLSEEDGHLRPTGPGGTYGGTSTTNGETQGSTGEGSGTSGDIPTENTENLNTISSFLAIYLDNEPETIQKKVSWNDAPDFEKWKDFADYDIWFDNENGIIKGYLNVIEKCIAKGHQETILVTNAFKSIYDHLENIFSMYRGFIFGYLMGSAKTDNEKRICVVSNVKADTVNYFKPGMTRDGWEAKRCALYKSDLDDENEQYTPSYIIDYRSDLSDEDDKYVIIHGQRSSGKNFCYRLSNSSYGIRAILDMWLLKIDNYSIVGMINAAYLNKTLEDWSQDIVGYSNQSQYCRIWWRTTNDRFALFPKMWFNKHIGWKHPYDPAGQNNDNENLLDCRRVAEQLENTREGTGKHATRYYLNTPLKDSIGENTDNNIFKEYLNDFYFTFKESENVDMFITNNEYTYSSPFLVILSLFGKIKFNVIEPYIDFNNNLENYIQNNWENEQIETNLFKFWGIEEKYEHGLENLFLKRFNSADKVTLLISDSKDIGNGLEITMDISGGRISDSNGRPLIVGQFYIENDNKELELSNAISKYFEINEEDKTIKLKDNSYLGSDLKYSTEYAPFATIYGGAEKAVKMYADKKSVDVMKMEYPIFKNNMEDNTEKNWVDV